MKNFIVGSIALYCFGMMVYAIWSYLAFVGLEKRDWVGSLVYLPHGVRVMAICYFGLISIGATLQYFYPVFMDQVAPSFKAYLANLQSTKLTLISSFVI